MHQEYVVLNIKKCFQTKIVEKNRKSWKQSKMKVGGQRRKEGKKCTCELVKTVRVAATMKARRRTGWKPPSLAATAEGILMLRKNIT